MPVSLAVALSFQGLKALGVPEESLASFPPEFQQGMATRGRAWGRRGERSRALGETAGFAGRPSRGGRARARHCPPGGRFRYARDALRDLSGVVSIWQQNVHAVTCATCSVSRTA